MSDNLVFVNGTQEKIRVAIFRRPFLRPSLGTFAWRIVAPRVGGGEEVPVPSTYEVFLNYPGPDHDHTDPNAGNQTAKIPIESFTSRFLARSGGHGTVEIEQVFEDLIPGQLAIVNQAATGVWGHVTQGESDIYRPQVLPPGSTLLEADPGATFFFAIVSGPVREGSLLANEEISSTTTPMVPGQVARVTGSVWTGYEITVK